MTSTTARRGTTLAATLLTGATIALTAPAAPAMAGTTWNDAAAVASASTVAAAYDTRVSASAARPCPPGTRLASMRYRIGWPIFGLTQARAVCRPAL